MKKFTLGVFSAREDAEKAINQIHNKLSVPFDDISYIYRDMAGEVKEVDAKNVGSKTAGEGAESGATTGAWIGGIVGVAVAAGVLPFAGPLFAAGPILSYLGITGAVGTAAAGAIGGAAVGGLIGALANMGVGKEKAMRYQDRVKAGDILVAIHNEDEMGAQDILRECGALEIDTYSITV